MQNLFSIYFLPPSTEFLCVPCQISNIQIEMELPSFPGSDYPFWIVASVTFIRKDNGNTMISKIKGDRVNELVEVLNPSIWSSRHPGQELRKLLGRWCVICIDGDNELQGIFGYEDFGLLPEPKQEATLSAVQKKQRKKR